MSADARRLFDLEGRVAIVTGGATGIGLPMATALAEAGAEVVVCARDGGRCEEAARELARSTGRRALGLACDVRSEADVDRVVQETLAALGRIDVLVNNAGTVRSGPPEETTLAHWETVVRVNLTGPFLFSQRVGRVLIEQGGGRIVNVSSMAGLVGAPAELMDTISYNASKGGLVAFTRDLACKWARHGITVNAIAPGWFPTDLTTGVIAEHGDELLDRIPLRRLGRPDDLKGVVVFLASAASAYVTGQTLVVDGGWTAW